MSEQLTLAGAARHVNVAVGTVRYWILSGRLPAEKVDSHWIIDADELERVNEEMKHGSGKRGRRGRYVPLESPTS